MKCECTFISRRKYPAGDASSVVKQAQSAGGNASLKPRRALGDITNKSGKEEAAASKGLEKANVRIEVVRSRRIDCVRFLEL
jgi:hypothetical protein